MRVEIKYFNKLAKELKASGYEYSTEARLFCAKQGTQYPPVQEPKLELYILYLTIGEKTLLVEHGIESQILDISQIVLDPPKDHIPRWMYATGLASYLNRPLEVVAFEKPGTRNRQPKWVIDMLRDRQRHYGYIDGWWSNHLADLKADWLRAFRLLRKGEMEAAQELRAKGILH